MKGKKVMELARGYWGKGKNCNAIAMQRVEKALTHQFKDRKMKKRDMRKLWITQLNAGAREYGMPYNKFVYGLSQANVEVNRKVMADLAVTEPLSFRALAEVARAFF